MLVKVHNKGQIVIPINLRKKYNIHIGEEVKIIEEKDGLKIIPANKEESVLELAGIFREYKKNVAKDLNDKEINKVTEQEFVKSFLNKEEK